jgi:iron-sulfur cluster assembly accessory protein
MFACSIDVSFLFNVVGTNFGLALLFSFSLFFHGNSVFEKDGARVILDTITLPMVSGSRIDYIEELIGSAFKVLANPHAAHSCGCDTSFEIKI